jgi:formylglycine-generating enzyme required for sulfatase activity
MVLNFRYGGIELKAMNRRPHRLKLMLIGMLLAPLNGGAASSLLVVDYGHDWGVGFYRSIPTQSLGAVDVNGDGVVMNESARGWPFSMETPLSPPENTYDSQLPTARFYGGVYVGTSERAVPSGPTPPSEGHINQNHELRDDWNLMALPSSSLQPELERYEASGLWLWKREDFLNGADAYPVSFASDNDYIAVFVSRYWGGVDWGRWIIQDNGLFFASEPTFAGRTARIDYSDADPEYNDAATNPVVRKSHIIHPTRVRWAPYDPAKGAPRAMFFDWQDSPDYQYREFDAVEAVGFLVQRELSHGARASNALTLIEPIAVKWNAVQVRATVARPETGSHLLDMAPVGGAEGAPNLWAARTEVRYQDWLRVFRWAVTNQRASRFSDGIDRHIRGYHFVRDGAIGSAEASLASEHSSDEPVTTITWYDAVAWCNALSEMEGYRPAYYSDAELSVPFRKILRRNVAEAVDDRYPVHWDEQADGFRLPTRAEWEALAADAAAHSDQAWMAENSAGKTHAVGQRNANSFGLFDMIGNVAEYIWDIDSTVFNPADHGAHAVMGGSFRHPQDENTTTLSPFGHRPWNGCYAIGFRPVRNGPVAGQLPSPGAVFPVRVIDPELEIGTSAQPLDVADLRGQVRALMPMRRVEGSGSLAAGSTNTSLVATDPYALDVAAVELPYALWIRVKQWAEQNLSYRFNYSGDMGSARQNVHMSRSPLEPVTEVSWFDAVIWCNALSELMGLEPVYRDRDGNIERTASQFRLTMFDTYGYPNVGPHYPYDLHGRDERDTSMDYDLMPHPELSGYRLPTRHEAVIYGNTAYEASHALNRTSPNYGWFISNARGKAMPVGTRLANIHGIHDALGNVQEWTYGGSGLFGQYRYGNDFGWSNMGYPHTMNRQDHVSSARPYLGFRVVSQSRTAPVPVLDPAEGTFENVLRITLTSSIPSAFFHYTLDGTEPGPDNGHSSGGAIELTRSAEIKVITLHPDWEPSTVVSAAFEKLEGLPLAAPYPLNVGFEGDSVRLDWRNQASSHTGFLVERQRVLAAGDVVEDVEIILDNAREAEVGKGAVQISNYWTLTDLEGSYGSSYLRRDTGAMASAVFTPDLRGIEGDYQVSVWHPFNNWTILWTRQPVIVHHAGGSEQFLVNGRLGGGEWKPLGTFSMRDGDRVEFNNTVVQASSGQSFVDAVRFFKRGNQPPWEPLAELDETASSYVDRTAVPGLLYRYRVRAISPDDSGNPTRTDDHLVPFALALEFDASGPYLQFHYDATSDARWLVRIRGSSDLRDWSLLLFDSTTHVPGQPQPRTPVILRVNEPYAGFFYLESSLLE